jgi:hypothetical protein
MNPKGKIASRLPQYTVLESASIVARSALGDDSSVTSVGQTAPASRRLGKFGGDEIFEANQCDLACPDTFEKIFCFSEAWIGAISPIVPLHKEALGNVIDAGRIQEELQDEGTFLRKAKPYGLAPRCCRQVAGSKTSRRDGDKKARSPGRARSNR